MSSNAASEFITKQLNYLRVILDKFKKYFDRAGDTIRGTNPQEYDRAVEAQKYMSQAKLILPDSIQTGFDFYEEIDILGDHLRALEKILRNEHYAKVVLYNMSATYTIDMRLNKNQALDAIEGFLHADDSPMFSLITAGENEYAWIVANKDRVNKWTIKLIGALLLTAKGEKRRKLEEIVEKQKDIVLDVTRVDISGNRGIQGTISRYCLRPLATFAPLEDLFAAMGLKYSETRTPEENMRKLDCNVIVLNRATGYAIEYDVRGMIDQKYILSQGLKTSSSSGLTEKILKKYDTVHIYPGGAGPGETIIKYTLPGIHDWYIFETFNGIHYRALSPDAGMKVHEYKIYGLVHGLSMRSHQYHELQAQNIISAAEDSSIPPILEEYRVMRDDPPPSEPIISRVASSMSEWFKGVQEENEITTPRDLRRLAVNTNFISETILGTLVRNARGVTSEYMVTYITKYDGIIRYFVKEFDRRWIEANIPDRMFSEQTKTQLRDTIHSLFMSIVTATAAELDRNRAWNDYNTSLKEYVLERKHIFL